jgi:uncharacterized protein (DUF2336 family)
VAIRVVVKLLGHAVGSLAVSIMGADLKFFGDVDNVVAKGSASRRAGMLRRVTDLFVVGAAQFTDEEVALFDDVIARLAADIEISARVLLASRLAGIPNAPPQIIRALAFDDALEVAAPVLSQSERLDDACLIENARCKSQGHMLAISRRRQLSEFVTDVLVERGDERVLTSVVENLQAKFSDAGFSILASRSGDNERLAISIGRRPDIPPQVFRQLLEKASQRVRTKLEAIYPRASREIRRVVAEVSDRIESEALDQSIDYAAALEAATTAQRSGLLDDGYLRRLAQIGAIAEITASIAVMCDLPLQFVDKNMNQRRSDTLLVMARSINLSWPTVKAIMMLRIGKHLMAETEIGQCLAAYERLGSTAALEILKFYRSRERIVERNESPHSHPEPQQ